MASDTRLYLLDVGGSEDDETAWVQPRPLANAVTQAVTTATDLDAADLDHPDAYVDLDDLRAVLDGDDASLTFSVEGYAVTVAGHGTVDID